MFTGIVEEQGTVVAVDHGAESARMRIRGPLVTSDAEPGHSISVNGVCLTVTDLAPGEFSVDVMPETLRRSSLATAGPGAAVNLERAMPAAGRFGGHVVQGHVDGTGTITGREPGDRWEVVTIAFPAALRRYVVEKGSITVDGVSLTVSAVAPLPDSPVNDAGPDPTRPWFQVSLIPTTLTHTTLGTRGVGESVNLEVDVLAKYVEAQLAHLGGGR